MGTILCPRASGVLSALGLAAADRRATEQRTVLLGGDALTAAALRAARDELADRAGDALGAPDGEVRTVLEVRYRGQAHELALEAPDPLEPAAVRERFETLHDERYGHRAADTPIEVVTVRVAVSLPGPELDLAGAEGAAGARERRSVVFGGERVEAEILRGEPRPGERIAGPAVCELGEATLAVPPGWSGAVDGAGTIVLERAS
jgi:N-methylhydantoinase A